MLKDDNDKLKDHTGRSTLIRNGPATSFANAGHDGRIAV
jgi:hypothetical protein